MANHPLPEGTWIRLLKEASDCGDFGERQAGVGSIGQIGWNRPVTADDGEKTFSYSVVIYPSMVAVFYDAAELDEEAEILADGSHDIPSEGYLELISQTADLWYPGCSTFDIKHLDGSVKATDIYRDQLVSLAAAHLDPDKAERVRELIGNLPVHGCEVIIPHATVDALGEIVGIGDRFLDQSFSSDAKP